MRADLRAQVDQGKNRDQIVEALIGVYGGQQFLTSPIDQGFNRLAWLFPYAIAGGGVVLVGFVATRWSRRRDGSDAEPSTPLDAQIEERLDDELRNLD